MRNAIHIVGPVALLFILPLLGACSSCGSFWSRTPCVAGARQVAPNACAPRCTPPPRACPPVRRDPCAAPYTAQAPTYRAQAPAQAAPPTTGASPATVQEMAVLDQVNRIRAQHGLRALRFDATLWEAARAHSDEQRRHGYMGHGSPDPARRTLAQRMGQAGYGGRVFAEVVAWGYTDTASVVEGWMNSPDHRRILLDPELTEGAFSRIGDYWTGNLGAPARYRAAAPRDTRAYMPPSRTVRRAPAPTPRYEPVRRPAPTPAPRAAPTPAPRRTQPAPAPSRSPQPALPIRSSGFG